MDPQRKIPVTGFHGSGQVTLLNLILIKQCGTGRVRGPEKGYVRCERRYPSGRLRTQHRRQ